MSWDPRFDDMMFGILNNVGNIEGFLEIVFSFLYRRTDFFKVKTSSSEKLGLPPGIAQKMVKVLSQKYVQMGKAKMAKTNPESGSASAGERNAEKKSSVLKEEINNNSVQDRDLSEQGDNQKDEVETATEAGEKLLEHEQKQAGAAKDKQKQADAAKDEQKEADAAKDEQKEADAAKEEEERRYYTSDPDSYNGKTCDNYSWSQTNFEVDVRVKVPDGVKVRNQVKVLVEKTHLKVEVLHNEKWQTLVDGTLMYEIKATSSLWTFFPNDHVHVTFEKGYPRYWEALLEGQPKLNVRAIDCSIPFEDIDEEAQAKLQQMMFDQHQKRLGKPTSEEIKVQEVLRQAWNKKDSPFRGQKFDPSVVNLSR